LKSRFLSDSCFIDANQKINGIRAKGRLVYEFKIFARINRYESAPKILVRSESRLILEDTYGLHCVNGPVFRSHKAHGRTVKLITSEIEKLSFQSNLVLKRYTCYGTNEKKVNVIHDRVSHIQCPSFSSHNRIPT